MEKSILTLIADNPSLLEAVRDVLEKQFAAPAEIANLDANTTNETLGQFLRARIAGMTAIRDAFREIEKHKSRPDNGPDVPNPAR